MREREGSLPRPIYSGRHGYKSVQGESTSRVRLGVFHAVRDMYSFLTDYFSSIVLVLHAVRCHAAQVGKSQGPTE
jgi:hypothetical protein